MKGYNIVGTTKEYIGKLICESGAEPVLSGDTHTAFRTVFEDALAQGIPHGVLSEGSVENELTFSLCHELTNETLASCMLFIKEKGYELQAFDTSVDIRLSRLFDCLNEKDKQDFTSKFDTTKMTFLEKTFLIEQLEQKFDSLVKAAQA